MNLRDYQAYAVNSVFTYFEKNPGNPLVALPTGTGKSLVIAGLIRSVFQWPGQRVVVATHVKELVEQNHKTLLRFWPQAPAGICSAGLGRKDTLYPIIFGGVATMVKNPGEFGKVDLMLIDEAHLVSPKSTTMYHKLISSLRRANPKLKVIGLTATPYRMKQGSLLEGEDKLFTDVCFDGCSLEAFNWFIDEGYLAPLIPRRTEAEIDVDGVAVVGGEYNASDLQQAADTDELNLAIVREMVAQGKDRKAWLVFATGIKHVQHITEILNDQGVPAIGVHSQMPDKERDQAIADFRAGKYRAIVNNGILTTGFDHPDIDLIAMLRPTRSPGLWVQMLGRGTRPVYAAGFDLTTTQGRLEAQRNGPKQNCLVLDFAGNTRRLGPINDPVMPRRGTKGGGIAPVKCCEVCGTYNHASARRCVSCGYEFPHRPPDIKTGASTDRLIATVEPPQNVTFAVERVTYATHSKPGKPPSLKVTYYCGIRRFDEWICIEHEGFAKRKADRWWIEHAGELGKPLPDEYRSPATVAEALERIRELRTPVAIGVWVNKQFPEIVRRDYVKPLNPPVVEESSVEEIPF